MSEFEFTEHKPKRGRATKQEEVAIEKEPITELPTEEKKDETPEKPQYDKDELLRIFDEIIFQGEYVEDVTIRGKLKVQFRTRTAEDIEQISKVIDSTSFNLIATLNESKMVLNLQYALTFYQGRDLSALKNEDKAKFIKRLPGPVIAMLLDALYKFDAKVNEACKDLEENF
jgi:hypothetical protein